MRRLGSNSINIRGVVFAIIVWGLVSSVCPGYSGGLGTSGEPYQIASKADLLDLAGTTTDYNKCFILTADINMEGQAFASAIIAADTSPGSSFEGTAFSGVFDGNDHKIANLAIYGDSNDYLGLFGFISSGSVKNLGLENCDVNGFSGSERVGSLAGLNSGSISDCYSTGRVSADIDTGGLCGRNEQGSIVRCYSTGNVSGNTRSVGGLCGANEEGSINGSITDCYSTGNVTGSGYNAGGLCGYNGGDVTNCSSTGDVTGGDHNTGGLCGFNRGNIINCYSTGNIIGNIYTGGLCGVNAGSIITGSITACYSTGNVTGNSYTGGLCGGTSGNITTCYSTNTVNGNNERTGGLCGQNYYGDIIDCYSTGEVIGEDSYTGGLCGENYYGDITNCYSTSAVSGTFSVGGLVGHSEGGTTNTSFWDIETTGQETSAGGTGKTTVEMQTMSTYTDAGWDFVGETANGTEDIWKICEGESYPQLWYEEKYGGGIGDANNPYLIYTPCQMDAIGADANDWDKHFKLTADIDLGRYSGTEFNIIGKYVGFQDPCNRPFVGVFDGDGHTISNFTYSTDGNDIGMFSYVAGDAVVKDLGLINPNISAGDRVGSLVARYGNGTIINCYTEGGTISGASSVGGLIGGSNSYIFRCYSTTAVIGENAVGGLVGRTLLPEPYNPNEVEIADSYSSGSVSGDTGVGGLVGWNRIQPSVGVPATISNCYATGAVIGNSYVGGLMGTNDGPVNNSFWDVNSSGQASSDGGTSKTTEEMQTKSTFTDAGWDFVDETANGTEDIWKICEGTNYPKFSWQIPPAGDFVCPDGVDFYDFAVFANQWLLEEIAADVWSEGGDGIVNFFDWAVFANQWQITVNYETLADFAEQWLKTGISYCIADIAPDGGDGIVDMPDLAIFAQNWLEGL